jgi:hypothetical protein
LSLGGDFAGIENQSYLAIAEDGASGYSGDFPHCLCERFCDYLLLTHQLINEERAAPLFIPYNYQQSKGMIFNSILNSE